MHLSLKGLKDKNSQHKNSSIANASQGHTLHKSQTFVQQ